MLLFHLKPNISIEKVNSIENNDCNCSCFLYLGYDHCIRASRVSLCEPDPILSLWTFTNLVLVTNRVSSNNGWKDNPEEIESKRLSWAKCVLSWKEMMQFHAAYLFEIKIIFLKFQQYIDHSWITTHQSYHIAISICVFLPHTIPIVTFPEAFFSRFLAPVLASCFYMFE